VQTQICELRWLIPDVGGQDARCAMAVK